MNKKQGSISVDLDSMSEYHDFYGYEYSSDSVCKIWDIGFPRVIDFFEENKIKGTFFVISDHLRFPEVVEPLRYLVSKGHEIASHTHKHHFPLSWKTPEIIREEIILSQKLLQDKFGVPVRGFRAPGYDINSFMVDCLEENGYVYDSSIMPSLLTPLIVLAAHIKSGLKTSSPFHFSHSIAPMDIYFPNKNNVTRKSKAKRSLVEIPISVFSKARLPFYPTFLNTIGMVGLSKMFPFLSSLDFFNFELHTIDFISHKDIQNISSLARHPGIHYPYKIKRAYYDWIVEELNNSFEWTSLIEIAEGYIKNETV